MKQEKRISYQAGITRTPSDFLCQDGELAECINLTTDNEELKPMVQPKEYITGAPTIIFIHEFNTEKRYITKTSNNVVGWGKRNSNGSFHTITGSTMFTAVGDLKVTAIGKTLVFSDNNGFHYYIWETNGYASYGDLPVPDVEFFLLGSENYAIHFDKETNIDIEEQGALNDFVVGLYTKHKKSIEQKKAFCLPFFVRTALKLNDGTYTHISQPILMFPSISENINITDFLFEANNDEHVRMTNVSGDAYYSKLYYKNKSVINSDICKSIVVFASAPIEIYDLSVDQKFRKTYIIHDGVYRESLNGISSLRHPSITPEFKNQFITKRDKTDIENDIKSTSIYYKLCELDLVGDEQPHDIGEKMETHTLENLTSQPRLDSDDYYSFCPLKASMLYSYNSRLNLANVERGFFKGFSNFVDWDDTSESIYDILVNIKTDNGDVVVHKKTDAIRTRQGVWFYYPDSRATEVRIMKGQTTILNTKLTEHQGLNGAYYFAGLPSDNLEPDRSGTFNETETDGAKELLPNYILQSEVSNPFVFKAAGYFRIETGEIYAISTITQALSQGQFGQFPLLVFSENGIWTLSVADTGYYSNIHPMSREVCINPNMVTQTDGAVFFASKKGLMVIVRNDVKCVSEQMNGKTFNTEDIVPLTGNAEPWATIIQACQGVNSFLDYIRSSSCMMAYDYIDSRLLIINPDYSFAYVYNMADGSISKTVLPAVMNNVVNDYPDYLVQSGTILYSFYEKPREEEISTRQRAFILTRPIKMAGPLTVSSLRELVNVGDWVAKDSQGNELSCVKTVVWLSDDMHTWHEMSSRFGAAAKYFRIGLFINMLPTERLSGTILTEQERRTNNLRA